ncbi:MAG: hypothetical protein A3I06_07385 [Candidatus Lindowbacteria bacterium RIFCSPLOWO2_02_FULL_62_12]|nr:MAG: hypothetical protein A3I06_07385 [Candidatus Lindowbacteria bacterium RIFCSPLOWO2_02_FULL_62_12]
MTERGYRADYAAAEAAADFGEPPIVADRLNREEAFRNWFRDPACVRAMLLAGGAFLAFGVLSEALILGLGLSGLDPRIAYAADKHIIDVRWMIAILSGPAAYALYMRRAGNAYRLTPFATLSVVMFLVTNLSECHLDFIAPFPAPECRIFLTLDVPSPFADPPLMSRAYMVWEFELSGFLIRFLNNDFRRGVPWPYSDTAQATIVTYLLAVLLSTSFILEKLKLRPSARTAGLLSALVLSLLLSACSRPREAGSGQSDVESLFRRMVENRRGLTVKDPIYQQIVKKGPGITPDLKRIAKNRDIQWHFIAYYMLGQIKDRSAIPFLMDALAHGDEQEQLHAVRGLNCLLRKGMYNPGDPGAEEVKLRYQRWWDRHQHEFPPEVEAR